MAKVLPTRDTGSAPRIQVSPPTSIVKGLVKTARPKQWTKNVLVFAAPGAAGVLTHGLPLLRALAALGVFCAVASGTYFLNDAIDVEADRQHPTKSQRPMAAGVFSAKVGMAIGVLLLLGAIGAGVAINWRTAIVLACYVAVQFAYSFRLKHEPIMDLACVAAGFVLRMIAGATATRVPVSQWFLVVAVFGSLMMVTGKRFAEHHELGEARGHHRKILALYSDNFLRAMITVSVGVTLTAYCLFAFEKQQSLAAAAGHITSHIVHHDAIWYQLSIVPFCIAILRYAYLIDTGHGGQPEDVVLQDRILQVAGLLWAVVFGLAVYVS